MTARGWLLVGFLSLGCAEVLGLETPEPRPAPDEGGTGGSATGGSMGTEGGEAGAPGGSAGTGEQGGSGGQNGGSGGRGGSSVDPGGAGAGGSPDCTEGDRRCGGETSKTPEICDETGNWVVNDDENEGEDCPVSCDTGRCIECEGAELGCDGKTPRRCVAGTWHDGTLCRHYCRDGACESPPSCINLADCARSTSCCSALEVPENDGPVPFSRDYDGAMYTDMTYKAHPRTFLLDEFEVTVERFRNFVDNYSPGSFQPGTGEADHIDGDGWQAGYPLPATAEELKASLACDEFSTWTAEPMTGYEQRPINCVNFFVAYAFCIWDGGRLPTEAEWNYAAAGGTDQRAYPWSVPSGNTLITSDHAVFDVMGPPPPVGSKPDGVSRWGHLDLAGSLSEWTLDFYVDDYPSTQCNDCLVTSGDRFRAIRGGSFVMMASNLFISRRSNLDQDVTRDYHGFRCVRDIRHSLP